jgi:hypothetical protein
MTTKDIIETYTDHRGKMTDYVIECDEHGRSRAAVEIRLVPRRPRDSPLRGSGTLRNDKIANRSGRLLPEIFEWAEKVIIARRSS